MRIVFTLLLASFLMLLSGKTDAYEYLKVSGVNGEISDNIQLLLSRNSNKCFVGEKVSQDYENNIQQSLTEATQPFGYYSPSFKLKSTGKKEDCAIFEVQVELGQPIKLSEISIAIDGEGKSDPAFIKAVEGFRLKKGDVLVDKHYEQLKNRLESTALERGYLDYELIKREILVSQQSYSAQIFLHFNSGQRYKLGDIEVVQDPVFLQQEFVDGMITLEPKQYFTNSELFVARQKLLDTNYFSSATLSLQRDKAENGVVPLRVELFPQNRIDYSVGVGFSTDTGPRLRFEYENRRVNDKGHQFYSKLNLSKVINEFSAGYKIPDQSEPSRSWYNFDFGYKEEDTDLVKSETTKLGYSRTRVQDNRWKNISFVDIVYDDFDTGSETGHSLLVVPGMSWNYLQSDDPVLPNNGYRVQFEVQGAHESLLSDASFLQTTAGFKSVTTLAPKHRFLFRTTLGTTSTSDLDKLPIDYRFFAGGDNSVRGYDYETISPQNDQGDYIGAKHLAVASLEYDYRFKESWAWAFFTDAGSAFNDSVDLKYSVGTGIRWISPIGPIRIDFAVPIDDPHNAFRVHVSLGPDL